MNDAEMFKQLEYGSLKVLNTPSVDIETAAGEEQHTRCIVLLLMQNTVLFPPRKFCIPGARTAHVLKTSSVAIWSTNSS
jgi:hypothetical protein